MKCWNGKHLFTLTEQYNLGLHVVWAVGDQWVASLAWVGIYQKHIQSGIGVFLIYSYPGHLQGRGGSVADSYSALN